MILCFSKSSRSRAWKPWLACLAGGVGLLACTAAVLDRIFPPDLSRLTHLGSTVLDRSGRVVALLPAPGGIWRLRTGVDDISPAFLRTLVTTEDRWFWWEPGVNPLALARAAFQDLRAGHIVSGGSSLTMQVARLLEPRPRTMRSKLIEIARAVQLTLHFSHRRILGIWLTLAPYGGNLEGARAGAMAWFGVSPRFLDASQAAMMVAIPRRPEALRPDRHADRLRRLRDRILAAEGRLTREAAAAAVPTRRQPMPRHAAQALAALPRRPGIATTLDLPMQQALERMAARRAQTLPPHAAIALLIADTSGEIRALATGGPFAMDLTRAIRSPGSALKPFIYALAFQDGLVGPETRVDDLPRRFGGYAPEDFDHRFSGPVTAGEALRRSLNLPAVGLLDRVGPRRFATALHDAGAVLHLPPGADPSLPLALGGEGITLRDAVGLYTALATDGRATHLRLLADAPAAHLPFVDPRAAAMVAGVITQPFPDGGPEGVAWKTGTSWGGRDAWSIGFDRAHVAAVWVGRPDGTALARATGRDLALPMLGRIFDLLPRAPLPVLPRPAPAGDVRRAADALRLLFPPDSATLRGDGAVTLRAMGGQRPLTFLIDGAPLQTNPARRETDWSPAAPGFYRITVLDADGAAAQAAIRVRWPAGSSGEPAQR
jgi:penicillin-binding protein 1C